MEARCRYSERYACSDNKNVRVSLRHRGRGYSLVEVLIAVFMLLLCVLTVAPCMSFSRTVTRKQQRTEIATHIAAAEIETYRGRTFTSLPAISSSSVTLPLTGTNSLPGGTGSTTFTKVDAALNETTAEYGRRKISVTVAWDDKLQDKGAVTLTSILVKG